MQKTAKFSRKMQKIYGFYQNVHFKNTNFCSKSEIGAVQKCVHLVDLEKC